MSGVLRSFAFLLLCFAAAPAWAEDAKVLRDVAYGPATRQTMDVYLPPAAKSAPVILMVHGGGWAIGDKRHAAVYRNKVERWVPRGFIFISVNYPMVPESNPVQQADDVARALAAAQNGAPGWGGDPDRFILMGHSAGAHLVSLLNADPERALRQGAKPWLGTVSLDSGALDVRAIMQRRHPKLFDRAFGDDPVFWETASPFHAVSKGGPPWLGVCSSQRRIACAHNEAYAARARRAGARAEVLGRDLSHSAINGELGKPGAYTDALETFMASLDPVVKAMLAQ